jgi:hypothetical protein
VHSVADIPTWAGILMLVVGLGLTIAMGKWVVFREQRRNGVNSKGLG